MPPDEFKTAVADFLTRRRFTLYAFGETYRDCVIVPERYAAEPQLALQVYHWTEGEKGESGYMEPFGRLTVCLPEAPNPGCVWVKTWSENKGWTQRLLADYPDVFEETGRALPTGYTVAQEWRIKIPRGPAAE